MAIDLNSPRGRESSLSQPQRKQPPPCMNHSEARYYIPLPQDSSGNTGFLRKVIKAIALGSEGQVYLHVVNENDKPTGERFPLSIEQELPYAIDPLSKKITVEYFRECSGPVRDLNRKEYIEFFHQALQTRKQYQSQ